MKEDTKLIDTLVDYVKDRAKLSKSYFDKKKNSYTKAINSHPRLARYLVRNFLIKEDWDDVGMLKLISLTAKYKTLKLLSKLPDDE